MPGSGEELLRAASAARSSGDELGARSAFAAAFDEGRQRDDAELMAAAALGMAAAHRFGTHPGRVPAYLHEAYGVATGAARTRLSAALARIWVYGNQPWHGEPFAAEAVADAERSGDPALLADALDAQLLVSWGPDQLEQRVGITTRLEDTVAHVRDVEARLSGYLWRLTTALESLDAVAVQRQLRALDALADETRLPRVRFFAASRRGMHALVRGDLVAAAEFQRVALAAGAAAGEADAAAIEHTLAAGIARQSGDRAALAEEAAGHEAFGTGEGVPSIAAEGATLWLAAGDPGRARSLLDQLSGGDLRTIPRDVDWLLTMTSLTEVASATGAAEHARTAVELLAPYADRGVVNAGAVAFVGVVADYLRMACTALGQHEDAATWGGRAAAGYQRIGAEWWLARLELPAAPGGTPRIRLSPGPDGIWAVGAEGRTTALRDLRGLHYLRLLLARPDIEIPAQQLSDEAGGHAADSVSQGELGEVIDRQAAAAYRRRLAELDDELEEAREWSDEGRRARARAEREALLQQLSAAAGLSGRLRATGATSERARVAVRKAIAAAIERVDAVDPLLGRLLRDTVHTGTSCRYEPDPARPVVWLLDGGPS
jgi:hypothetical protein